ncbi:MAG: DNA mismatch repair protein MutS [Thermobacillus sp. ZCTH02-B1]|uniref:DNA mismatch repair protein MutS n=1 Tax=Thermobacillus sp. ZCTH02-B1 TaxID=1858795 RepID=UPI000B54B592|nr:DNA mismatch repair protein MutS [Thermobacillus sp. ZCTH02-B1]OUM96704.1 MAG: DNA mismatch repair protein MutS [Thermobacillus sp. ZCTH02-B1]
MTAQYTPMIQQYLAIKEQVKDAFLFFRLGDFYELFFDDAILAARELEITLTGRDGGAEERIPMCGVPYHSAESYIAKLIDKGYKVAICEQVEDPKSAKGVVRREIVRIVTPGTIMETRSLEERGNNFIAGLAEEDGVCGLAVCDLSTGELYVTSFPAAIEAVADETGVYQPREIVGAGELLAKLKETPAMAGRNVVYTPRETFDEARLAERFGADALAGLAPARRRAIGVLTGYLEETQRRALVHLNRFREYEPNQFMVLDQHTRRNLELTETVHERSRRGSLLWLLDRTCTAMGARTLRRWIDKPLLSRAAIEERLDAVDRLVADLMLREELRAALNDIYDLERLVGRIAYGSANARDLIALKTSLRQAPRIAELCASSQSPALARLVDNLDTCSDIADWIEAIIVDDPPVSVREGGLIKSGCDEYLDRLREASVNGKRWIAELERAEREATGIKSLKVGYNKVFGYYIEVSKPNLPLVPEGRYERKQTLANAERFVTPELKEKEQLILEAEEKMVELEYRKFCELRDRIAGEIDRLQKLAGAIAAIDALQSFAHVSAERRYVRPVITEGFDLVIEDGRHPVVETMTDGEPFIANGTHLTAEAPMLLITGPNMAGKSTYMRQAALICIMAQIGCFVPAKRAEIPLTDRIFTRIGAADDLAGGRSTFMVEMKEIQVMTERATRRSLVIIDELGRGTSTSEGMAIAQAVIEYVHDRIGCKALVSTHFHELARLEETLPGLRNGCMAVAEEEGTVTFLRKLVPGAAGTSYGIYCAQLAGLPASIIARAYELLHQAERDESRGNAQPAGPARPDASGTGISSVRGAAEGSSAREAAPAKEEPIQLALFEEPAAPSRPKRSAAETHVLEQLRKVDLMNMTPLMAMQWIHEMKMKLNE